jgi:hypothetical protein
MVWIFFDVENQITRQAKRDTSNYRLAVTPNERCFLDRKGASRAVTARGKAKLARVVAIQKIALKFIGRNSRWDRLNDGPEVMK